MERPSSRGTTTLPVVAAGTLAQRAVLESMAGVLGLAPEAVPADASFASLGADWLDVLELVVGVEEELGVSLAAEPIEPAATVAELVAAAAAALGTPVAPRRRASPRDITTAIATRGARRVAGVLASRRAAAR